MIDAADKATMSNACRSAIRTGVIWSPKSGLQELWVASLDDRARLANRSAVPVLDDLLAAQHGASSKIGSHCAPRIGQPPGGRPGCHGSGTVILTV
jgi:hypothetical protein